jgi:hypothetical protein
MRCPLNVKVQEALRLAILGGIGKIGSGAGYATTGRSSVYECCLKYDWEGRQPASPGHCHYWPHLLTPAVLPVHPAVAIPGVTQPVATRELLAQAPSMAALCAHQSNQVQPPEIHLQVLLLFRKHRPCRAPCPIPVTALQPSRRKEVTGNI